MIVKIHKSWTSNLFKDFLGVLGFFVDLRGTPFLVDLPYFNKLSIAVLSSFFEPKILPSFYFQSMEILLILKEILPRWNCIFFRVLPLIFVVPYWSKNTRDDDLRKWFRNKRMMRNWFPFDFLVWICNKKLLWWCNPLFFLFNGQVWPFFYFDTFYAIKLTCLFFCKTFEMRIDILFYHSFVINT